MIYWKNRELNLFFQPIVSLTSGQIIGYEGLSRIVDPQMIKSAEDLFYLAGLYGEDMGTGTAVQKPDLRAIPRIMSAGA